jgi:hypothetical protein
MPRPRLQIAIFEALNKCRKGRLIFDFRDIHHFHDATLLGRVGSKGKNFERLRVLKDDMRVVLCRPFFACDVVFRRARGVEKAVFAGRFFTVFALQWF